MAKRKEKHMESAAKNWDDTEREIEDRASEIKGQAKEVLKQGEESVKKVVSDLDKRLHDDPWTVVAGVAVASLLLGFILGGTRR